jgi:hypothetical protein
VRFNDDAFFLFFVAILFLDIVAMRFAFANAHLTRIAFALLRRQKKKKKNHAFFFG